MAEAIVGRRTVLISTDDTSRRALRAVGKVAATTDDVIHLARAPRADARTAEVMAHELTHVAHPSPTPRFFDDDHRGPEERRAEEIGRIMARAPLTPSAPVARPEIRRTVEPTSRSRGSSAPTVRRRSEENGPRMVTADEMAARLTGGRSGSSDTVRRLTKSGKDDSWSRVIDEDDDPDADDTWSAAMDDEDDEGEKRPGAATAATAAAATGAARSFLASDEGADWFRDQLRDNADMVFRLLEDHIVVELERRGGRSWNGL